MDFVIGLAIGIIIGRFIALFLDRGVKLYGTKNQ